jgi:glycosyltransferase involved in cell wall biosynthesis
MVHIRTAFVMEQTLGHVTHSQNLLAALAARDEILPTWLPISFGVRRAERLVPLLRSNWSVRASWRTRQALAAALAAHPHDALVLHTQVTSLFSVGMMRRVPSVVSLDATPINYDSVGEAYGHRGATDSFFDRSKFELNRRAFLAAARLVAWSEWARRSLIDDYGVRPENVTVLAPGAHSTYFDIGQKRISASSERTGPVRLLFVGGDFRRKGGHTLLEAVRGLEDGCELDIVTKDAIEHQPTNVRVHTGIGPNSPELLRLFAAADAFVLPTSADCLAVVLMEATAAALPIITTDVGALSEAVTHQESGLLVPPGDVAALRQAISNFVEHPDVAQRMGRAGFALARQKFDAARNNHALLDLVLEVAQNRPAGRKAA